MADRVADIRALKEVVAFPLLYPEIYSRFSIAPPRGVLFIGPPGKAKPMARAGCHLPTVSHHINSPLCVSPLRLHSQCSFLFHNLCGCWCSHAYPCVHCIMQYGKQVSFFMRKGADCLSKWVGESERQLRLLFDEAYKRQPAIIFFDEIDGIVFFLSRAAC